MPPIPRRAALLAAAAVLGLSACGSNDTTSSGQVTDPGADASSTATSSQSDLPAVEVVDVVTGASLELTELASSDRPILLWFWAPH